MGTVLAKLPQQRIRAPQNHPTVEKLEQLFDYMDDLGLDIRVDFDRIYVTDTDRNDGEWEIRDLINSDHLSVLPCQVDAYKITQTVDITPREAQAAPESPLSVQGKASGLNHCKTVPAKPVKKLKKAKRTATVSAVPPVHSLQAKNLMAIGGPAGLRGKK